MGDAEARRGWGVSDEEFVEFCRELLERGLLLTFAQPGNQTRLLALAEECLERRRKEAERG